MPVNDILNCTEEDLWPILDRDEPFDTERWFLGKGIGMIELSKLGEMLGVDSYDNLRHGFNLVGEPRDDGPWPQTIPDSLVKRLAAITDEEIATAAPKWLELEEFRGAASVDSLTDYLTRLRAYLSARSGKFFLINAL
jgi:hypothetical protein